MPDNQSNNEAPDKSKRKQTWVVMISTVVVLFIIALIVVIVFQNKDKASQTPANEENQTQTGINAGTDSPPSLAKKNSPISYVNQPRMGKEDAPVRIAEFGDYKCTYCQQFEQQIFPKLKKEFIDTGKVQFYFMNYTIIAQDSVLAANSSEAVFAMNPDHFWDFHQLLYESQGPENVTWATKDTLLKIAKRAVPDLDADKFKKALEDKTYIEQIKTDAEMGKAAGVTGTPSVFVNGKLVPGPETFDYESLKGYIQKALDGE